MFKTQEYKGIGMMVGAALLASVAQVCFKFASTESVVVLPIGVGILCYVGGFFLNLAAYRHGRLAILFPISALAFLFVAMAGVWVFEETVSLTNAIGLALIVLGAVLIGGEASGENQSNPKEDPASRQEAA